MTVSPLSTWDEDNSDMNSETVIGAADLRDGRSNGDSALKSSVLLTPLSPKTLAQSSPASKRSFPFFDKKKKTPSSKRKNSKKLIENETTEYILEDARQAALNASYLAARGIIVEKHDDRNSNYVNPNDDGSIQSTESIIPHHNNHYGSSSIASVTSSFDAITSVTAGASHDVSSINGGNPAVSLKPLRSGTIQSDGSVTLGNKRKTNKKKENKTASQKKVIGLANKLGLTTNSKAPNNGSSDGGQSAPKTSVVKKVTQELWMCNLCGQTFASKQTSEEHERICIRMACCTSGDLFDPNSVALPAAEVLYSDAILLKEKVRKLMCMSDQSVIKVIAAAKPYVLTVAELYCEHELKMLARDCAYYYHIERRAELRREQSGRYVQSSRGRIVASYVRFPSVSVATHIVDNLFLYTLRNQMESVNFNRSTPYICSCQSLVECQNAVIRGL